MARWGRALIAEQKRLDQGVMDSAIKDTAEKVAKQTTLVLSPQIAASQAQTAVESGRAERNKYIALIEAVLIALFGGYTGLHVFGLVK